MRSPRIPLHYYQGFVVVSVTAVVLWLLGSNVVPVRLCGAAIEHAAVEHAGASADSPVAEAAMPLPTPTAWTPALDATALAHRDALAQLLLQVGLDRTSMFGESTRDAPVDAHAGAV